MADALPTCKHNGNCPACDHAGYWLWCAVYEECGEDGCTVWGECPECGCDTFEQARSEWEARRG